MNRNNAYTFFWQKDSPFSQWYPSTYILDGKQFHNAEQGMMYGKAMLFGDVDTASKILKTQNPQEVKALGRRVKGFVEDVWEKHREEIVFRNNVAKFSQNPNLKTILLSTMSTVLVEASPFDTIWGIGLSATHPDAKNPQRWQGLNLLGKTLTKVRDSLN